MYYSSNCGEALCFSWFTCVFLYVLSLVCTQGTGSNYHLMFLKRDEKFWNIFDVLLDFFTLFEVSSPSSLSSQSPSWWSAPSSSFVTDGSWPFWRSFEVSSRATVTGRRIECVLRTVLEGSSLKIWPKSLPLWICFGLKLFLSMVRYVSVPIFWTQKLPKLNHGNLD